MQGRDNNSGKESFLVSAEGLRKAFGKKIVLNGLEFGAKKGESWIILGPSGEGKTVLFRCLLGFEELDQGAVVIMGTDISQESPRERQERFSKIGVVFQESCLFDYLTVAENVGFRLYGKDPEANNKVDSVLQMVGLTSSQGGLYPWELSGGMKRRASIARAIIHQPELLFMDEPTSGLDPVSSYHISHLLKQLIQELKTTAMIITHDLVSTRILADRVAFLKEGRVFWEGGKAELFQTQRPDVRNFVEKATLKF